MNLQPRWNQSAELSKKLFQSFGANVVEMSLFKDVSRRVNENGMDSIIIQLINYEF